MNIIEKTIDILMRFPKISEVCNEIHVDFSSDTPTSYGLSSTGDSLVFEDVLGNQTRRHTFILYAVYQSLNDFDRLLNSGVLLGLATWLEAQAEGEITKITTANGMLYPNPEGNLMEGVRYHLQIAVEYKTE